MRLGQDCGPRVLGAVSRRYRRIVLPLRGRVILAAELGRFTADADTAPGLLERLHNRSTPEQRAGPGAVAAATVTTQGQVAHVFTWYHTSMPQSTGIILLCVLNVSLMNKTYTCPSGYNQ